MELNIRLVTRPCPESGTRVGAGLIAVQITGRLLENSPALQLPAVGARTTRTELR